MNPAHEQAVDACKALLAWAKKDRTVEGGCFDVLAEVVIPMAVDAVKASNVAQDPTPNRITAFFAAFDLWFEAPAKDNEAKFAALVEARIALEDIFPDAKQEAR